MEYVSKQEFDSVVADMDERVRKQEVVTALKTHWRKHGCYLSLEEKLEALKNA